MKKFKIRTGDEVVVISGAQKGHFGKVVKLLPSESRLVISGVNMASKHTKPSSSSDGGIVSMEMPIHISNVALRDPDSGMPTRVKYSFNGDTKVRLSKKTGKPIKFVRG
jgi:large subunit ribosomal protein L24